MDQKIYKRSELEEEKPKIVIGTIGHVGHGKTAVMASILKFFGKEGEWERKRPDTIRGIEL